MKCHIYLFRHGLTTYNKQKKFTGFTDAKLTSQGIKDAKKIAKKLKDKKISVAYHSHLSRSVDTLKEVLKYHPECKEIIEDDRIIERCYGELQGKTHEGYKKELKKEAMALLKKKNQKLTKKELDEISQKVAQNVYDTYHRSYDIPPPGGESIKMVEKRVYAFIKDLLKKIKKEKVNVAISAHGNSMRPFRRYFEKMSLKQMMKLENPWDDYFHYVVEV